MSLGLCERAVGTLSAYCHTFHLSIAVLAPAPCLSLLTTAAFSACRSHRPADSNDFSYRTSAFTTEALKPASHAAEERHIVRHQPEDKYVVVARSLCASGGRVLSAQADSGCADPHRNGRQNAVVAVSTAFSESDGSTARTTPVPWWGSDVSSDCRIVMRNGDEPPTKVEIRERHLKI